MKVRTKILLGFLVVVFISVAIGVVGTITTNMLSSVSTELHNLQAEGASISNVLNAHYLWRQNLTEAVLNGTEFTGSLDSNTCTLGKWHGSEEARSMTDPELLQKLTEMEAPHAFIHEAAGSVVELIASGDLEGARQYLNDEILPTTQEVISVLTWMQERYSFLTEAKNEESNRIEAWVTVINIILVAFAIVVGVLLAILIANLISKPLTALTAFMQKAASTGNIILSDQERMAIEKYSKVKDETGQTIAAATAFIGRITEVSKVLSTVAGGDLTAEITALSDKDVLGDSLRKMTDNLNKMFEEINTASSQVSTGSHQVASGAQALAAGSTEQAASVQELSSSIADVAARTKDNSQKADAAAELANTIKKNAEKGSEQMDDMIKSVRDIDNASQSISKVIKTIDDIAFQTNILALNAAVEAARAGQHGKGFAVVAEEVRNLAVKSAEAAKDTESLIAESMKKAEHGVKIAEETASSLTQIVSGINESTALVTEIARVSEEQSLSIAQINVGIDQVAKVVQQNSATSEESAAASEEMSGQSAVLQELISQFKLKKESVSHRYIESGYPVTKSIAQVDDYQGMVNDNGHFGKY